MSNDFNMDNIKKHTVIQSIVLHLLPGVLIGAMYYLLALPISNAGYPTLMAMIIACIIVLIPGELGIVYLAKRKQGKKPGNQLIPYQNKLTVKEYIFWALIVMILMGLVFTLGEPLSNIFRDSIFSWIPEVYHLDFGYSSDYSVSVLTITYTVGFIIAALIAPTVEEIYFRGYLLPRIPNLKGFSTLFHSFLFALYHFWTPWMILTRFIGVYPLIYVVNKKQNIYIGIIVHALINAIDFVVGFIFIIGLL